MQQALVPTQLLIADGHHRYETAIAFHLEDGSPDESAYTFAVLVNINIEGARDLPDAPALRAHAGRGGGLARERGAGRERRGGAAPASTRRTRRTRSSSTSAARPT